MLHESSQIYWHLSIIWYTFIQFFNSDVIFNDAEPDDEDKSESATKEDTDANTMKCYGKKKQVLKKSNKYYLFFLSVD